MKLTNPELIVKRSYKEVYKDGDKIVKIFEKDHPKSAVFNEALNTVRVEEAGLDIPKLDEVTQIDEKWALVIECQAGETLETVMEKDPDNLEKYMAEFVDLQLQIHAKTAPMLTKLKDKLAKQINQLKELDATQRYELLVRLESMPKHTKVCHGDFNPRLGTCYPGECQRRCGTYLPSVCTEEPCGSRDVSDYVLQEE